MVEHAELWRKARRFLAPVEDQGSRRHHQRRSLALGAARLQHSQYLRGLSNSHVVGETAAEAELAQEVHPAESFPLVIAEPAGEALRLCRRSHPAESAQALPSAFEDLVHAYLGLCRQH